MRPDLKERISPSNRPFRRADYIRRRKAVIEEEGTAPLFCSLTFEALDRNRLDHPPRAY